jgi:putative membrane protein
VFPRRLTGDGPSAKKTTEGKRIVIPGFSINGTWPAGLLVALGVVLLIILAVRIGGRRARRGDPGRGEAHPHGPDRPTYSRQVLEEMYARGELSLKDYQERIRMLSRGA